jgi:anti-sigma B factor antagonist
MTIETVSDAGAEAVRVLRADGELDVAVAPDLLARVPELVKGAGGVVLDLRTVTFLDSAGIRLLDRFARECGQCGVRFSAVAPERRGPRRILEIVGFGPPLVEDELSRAIDSASPRTA